jgi:catechol 2,3-dioxygenase-like lactoylglutathione lyase family enzyme
VHARAVTPILNVSDLEGSFAWFARFGWDKHWAWCPPDGRPSFGAVMSGDYEIFLCLDGQGGRGGEEGGLGTWMSIWVDDVDAVHAACAAEGLQITLAPQDMPWGVREMHVRHPDGHVFRVTQVLTPEPD